MRLYGAMPPLKAVVIQLVSHSLVATDKESGARVPNFSESLLCTLGKLLKLLVQQFFISEEE